MEPEYIMLYRVRIDRITGECRLVSVKARETPKMYKVSPMNSKELLGSEMRLTKEDAPKLGVGLTPEEALTMARRRWEQRATNRYVDLRAALQSLRAIAELERKQRGGEVVDISCRMASGYYIDISRIERPNPIGQGLEQANHLRQQYRHEVATELERRRVEFKNDALAHVGLSGHPKAEQAFELAWREAHSSGFEDVLAFLSDLAELLL